MEKQGIITEIIENRKDGSQILKVFLNTKKTESMCTVKIEDIENGVSMCDGCTGCGGGNQTGVFAVHGNILNVLNTTGKEFHLHDLITIYASTQKQIIQTVLAIISPIFLSILGFVITFNKTNNEGLSILGVFAGAIVGIVFALMVGNIKKDSFMPKVIL